MLIEEFIVCIQQFYKQGMMGSGADTSAWLTETPLLDRLLDALGSTGVDATVHANAAEVLVGIARGAPSALVGCDS